jgi:hypothetical protein
MQLHRPDGLETGSASQLDIFSQSWACCESDAALQISRLSDDDNEKTADVLAHPLASTNPKLIKIARAKKLTRVMACTPKAPVLVLIVTPPGESFPKGFYI